MTDCVNQWLNTEDGQRLYVEDYLLTDRRVLGNLVLIHGLGEHCGRYAHLIAALNEAGWQVRCYDQRGHGKSDGARGDVPKADSLYNDASLVIDDWARHTGAAPVLLGHSMGGLVAAYVATRAANRLRGLVLSSPALALPLNPIQKFLLATLGAIAPGLGVSNGLQTRYLSHDPGIEPAYLGDSLVHGKITARMLRGMLAMVEAAHRAASGLTLPVLMLVAGDDHLVDARGSRAFAGSVPAAQLTLHWYDQLFHEVFNEREPERQRVIDALLVWLSDLEQ